MLIKIVEVKKKPFAGQDGMIDFFWTKGVRSKDEATIQFGGVIDYTAQIGTTLELPIEKRELSNGKYGYRDTTKLA